MWPRPSHRADRRDPRRRARAGEPCARSRPGSFQPAASEEDGQEETPQRPAGQRPGLADHPAGSGLAALVLIGLISAFGGYSSGIGLRQSAEGTQMAQSAEQQFQLGLEDMAQGNFFRARQRFEYVIQLAPGYPGATKSWPKRCST